MYKVGDEVSYGLHGKCVITGIETKTLGANEVSFYQIRVLKNPITAKVPGKHEPSILIPVDTAPAKGLRHLMTKTDAETILKLLSEPDYHFELNGNWLAKQKLLEDVIRKEGAIGLAKVVGHVYVLLKQDAVPPSQVSRFYDNVYRIFLRELADAMDSTPKDIEPIVNRALRNKLSKDN